MDAPPPFQQLLDAHGADLHRFCLAQAGPHHGPDCFQEAVIAALRAYPDLRDHRNLRGWLFTIAHHKVLDHHRATARRPVPAGAVPERPAEAEPALDGDLWRAVARLPEKQRGAVALRYLGDLPYADIAVALDCSEAAARQNVRAGLAALRQEVTPR
ncbi:MAG TPA: RNA polymerase sigma factor [Ornithinibacter sp.]|nr:RNA polymerase sigma factor [Ornithinibacter sp.]